MEFGGKKKEGAFPTGNKVANEPPLRLAGIAVGKKGEEGEREKYDSDV